MPYLNKLKELYEKKDMKNFKGIALKIKLAVFMCRLLPTKLLLKINYNIQNVKINKYKYNNK